MPPDHDPPPEAFRPIRALKNLRAVAAASDSKVDVETVRPDRQMLNHFIEEHRQMPLIIIHGSHRRLRSISDNGVSSSCSLSEGLHRFQSCQKRG